MIEDAQNTVDRITRQYKRGLITEEERYKEVVETWKETDDELTKALLTGLDKYNNIFMMADSGARGSDKQIKQILEKVINIHGATKTAEVLDDVKAMGYGYSTRAAMTVSISDMRCRLRSHR